jgi:beta-lactamase regulating signal transducer with metallopeptidase domain/Tol biopolymer transport system component
MESDQATHSRPAPAASTITMPPPGRIESSPSAAGSLDDRPADSTKPSATTHALPPLSNPASSSQHTTFDSTAETAANSSKPILFALWLAGAIVYAAAALWTTGQQLRRIRNSQETVGEALQNTALAIARKLKIRTNFDLVVVDQPLGPLTFGIWCPTVVLPRDLVEVCTADELESLLAHELVHVRRRDSLVGLLQIIVQSVWWFHPLVWWANRQISYERERCCDEQVVAGLNCLPSCYAHSLLRVLDIKRKLRCPAALPGIRPFEITRRRLDHVLQNAPRFHPRMQTRYWLVLAIGILLLLPGARLTQGQATDPVATTGDVRNRNNEADNNAPNTDDDRQVTRLLSPDGKHIAYGQMAVSADGEQILRIIVGNADGTNRKALAIPIAAAESVDEVQWYGNDRIAYVTEHGQDGYFLMDLQGKPAGRLTMPAGCDSFFHQCLSPDGRWIAYCGNYSEIPDHIRTEKARRDFLKANPDSIQQHGVFVVNLEQQTVKQLLDQTVANLPDWSSDSKWIAAGIGQYVSHYPLVLINVNSGEVRKPDVQGAGVSWSPNDDAVAMTTDIVSGGSWRGGVPLDGALGIWNIAEQELKRISPPGTNVYDRQTKAWSCAGSHQPVWSRDGQWIAYRRTQSSREANREATRSEDVWVVRSDGTQQRKVLNHGVSELAWATDGSSLLWVDDARFGRIDLQNAQALGPTPVKPDGAFTIYGRVTDDAGQPMPDVKIHVARGIGSLRSTLPVTTDADGQYEIHFGPAMLSSGANMQFASAFADKPGFYEKDLCQAGSLAMANFRPAGYRDNEWDVSGIVYRDHPYNLDFVMLPAARVSVQLVDANQQPLADFRVKLDGEKLYPSSSVLYSEQTDEKGRIEFESVPLFPYMFALGGRRSQYETAPITLDQPKLYHIRLVYDDIAGTLTAEQH